MKSRWCSSSASISGVLRRGGGPSMDGGVVELLHGLELGERSF